MTRFPDRLAALLEPDAYPHATGRIELVETHVSWVLLTGQLAYKIKRPVQHAFVDLRAPERRAFFCHEELRLNRRFAPDLYLNVVDITVSASGRARIGGSGTAIEQAVCMRQFRREEELDRLLAADRVEPAELRAFGRDLADIHARLPVAAASDRRGDPDAVDAVVLENVDECERAADVFGASAGIAPFRAAFVARLDGARQRIAARAAGGRVRECHGDLHARNIVRTASGMVAFDCMEFEPAFRWIDVAEEIAFLIVDLRARARPVHAHAFRTGYLERSGDWGACRVLDLYAAHRSLVRAKVAALTAAGESDAGAVETLRAGFEDYVRSARDALAPREPVLVLVAGMSGAGKTWLAERIAPELDAVHLRSDVERKRLAGLDDAARTDSAPGEGLYAPAMSRRTYEALARAAADATAGGMTAVVDATFIRREDRARFRALATELGVPVCLVRCGASHDVRRRRVGQRSGDASEATPAILAWQEARAEPVEPGEEFAILDADTTNAGVVDDVVRWIRAARRSPGYS